MVSSAFGSRRSPTNRRAPRSQGSWGSLRRVPSGSPEGGDTQAEAPLSSRCISVEPSVVAASVAASMRRCAPAAPLGRGEGAASDGLDNVDRCPLPTEHSRHKPDPFETRKRDNSRLCEGRQKLLQVGSRLFREVLAPIEDAHNAVLLNANSVVWLSRDDANVGFSSSQDGIPRYR